MDAPGPRTVPVLTKRKSETDVTDNIQPKRMLTERIAYLRLTDAAHNPTPITPQGIAMNAPASPLNRQLLRTNSTPSNFYSHPTFTPSRPDLVSSFELHRPATPTPTSANQCMDVDMNSFSSAANTVPMASSSYPPSPFQYPPCTTATTTTAQPPYYPIYSDGQLSSNAMSSALTTTAAAPPTPATTTITPATPKKIKSYKLKTPIQEDDEKLPKYTVLIPKIPNPILDPQITSSRALILYTPVKEVIEESLSRRQEPEKKDDESMRLEIQPADLVDLVEVEEEQVEQEQDLAEQMMLD